MQRLRSTFTRSRTPTGAEMKSQSSLEVPKQVRSASFDEIQLEAQRQESQANVELKSIAKIAMATSSSLTAAAAATTTSSSSSSYSPSRSQTTDATSTGAVRKVTTLKIPQLQTGQRSKSFDVAAHSERSPNLLDRSSSSAGVVTTAGSFTASSYGYVTRWRSSGERENPPAQAYSCWHCACVDEYRASIGANDSWEDDDDEEDDDDDDEDEDADGEYGSSEIDIAYDQEQELEPPPTLQVERDNENTYYFVVLQRASEDADDDNSDCSRREGSPEIRVTLSTANEKTTTSSIDRDADSSDVISTPELIPENRQRRRSLSRQEALTAFPPELPAILGISISQDDGGATGLSSPDEDEDEDENDDSDRTCEPRDNQAAGLVVRDIFLTVPDIRRDRAASVDSCFNNNKNGKVETCYSLQVPQQSARSKSVDIVLPTEATTRYTALLPGNDDSRTFGYVRLMKIFRIDLDISTCHEIASKHDGVE